MPKVYNDTDNKSWYVRCSQGEDDVYIEAVDYYNSYSPNNAGL